MALQTVTIPRLRGGTLIIQVDVEQASITTVPNVALRVRNGKVVERIRNGKVVLKVRET